MRLYRLHDPIHLLSEQNDAQKSLAHYHAQWDPHVCPISTNHNEVSFLLETARPRKLTLLTTRLDAFSELVFCNVFVKEGGKCLANIV